MENEYPQSAYHLTDDERKLHQQLADDLTRLVGVDFSIAMGGVSNIGSFSPEQNIFFTEICSVSGLYYKIFSSDDYDIRDLDFQKKAVDAIHEMVAEEPARIKKLGQSIAILKKKTGIDFHFDEKQMFLKSDEQLNSYYPITILLTQKNAFEKSSNVESLKELEKKGIIKLYQTHDNDYIHKAMVFDVDIEKLKLLPDMATATPLGRPAEVGWNKG